MCTARTERGATPRPAWGRLYGIVLVTGALGLVIVGRARVGALHHLLEVLVVVASFGAMLLWVQANRVALSLASTCDCAAVQIRVVESRPARPRPRPPRELEIPVPLEASR